MRLTPYTQFDFLKALQALLPPGLAWVWRDGGVGDQLLIGTSVELARLDISTQLVLDHAVKVHKPAYGEWTLAAYRQVAESAISGVREILPRKVSAIGGRIGDRLWSSSGLMAQIPLLQIDHLVGPSRIGGHIGDALWSSRGRYVLRVRYFRSVVNPADIWMVLNGFKQAHVFLYMEDITGVGGGYGTN